MSSDADELFLGFDLISLFIESAWDIPGSADPRLQFTSW